MQIGFLEGWLGVWQFGTVGPVFVGVVVDVGRVVDEIVVAYGRCGVVVDGGRDVVVIALDIKRLLLLVAPTLGVFSD